MSTQGNNYVYTRHIIMLHVKIITLHVVIIYRARTCMGGKRIPPLTCPVLIQSSNILNSGLSQENSVSLSVVFVPIEIISLVWTVPLLAATNKLLLLNQMQQNQSTESVRSAEFWLRDGSSFGLDLKMKVPNGCYFVTGQRRAFIQCIICMQGVFW